MKMKSSLWLIAIVFISISGYSQNLPKPVPEFNGKIGTSYKDSKEDFPPLLIPDKEAPNVLLILIDDIGFTSDLESRLIRHNQKSKGFTGNVNDWKVVYTEKYETNEIAHKRELHIKSWKSRIKIQELIQSKD